MTAPIAAPLRLPLGQCEWFLTPRSWKDILATRWYTEHTWRRLVIQAEDDGVLYWSRKRKVWTMQKRCDTDKVPLEEIRRQLEEHERMVSCPCGAEDAECTLCHGIGAVPVTLPKAG